MYDDLWCFHDHCNTLSGVHCIYRMAFHCLCELSLWLLLLMLLYCESINEIEIELKLNHITIDRHTADEFVLFCLVASSNKEFCQFFAYLQLIQFWWGNHCEISDPPLNRIWWLCLVPILTIRFGSDLGYRMAKNLIGLYCTSKILFMNNDIKFLNIKWRTWYSPTNFEDHFG